MANKRSLLASISEELARRTLRGNKSKCGPELEPILSQFRKDKKKGFDWCAAFVFHCCIEAGFSLPARHPVPVKHSFAGVSAWIQWARMSGNGFYYSARNIRFRPQRGDLIIYNNLLGQGPNDHIGVILSGRAPGLVTAEGNIGNVSGIFRRDRTRFVKGFIRIPSSYQYRVE